MANRLVFPEDFKWGAATASYQIEGAAREDGKGPSIWDTFSHTPGATLHGDTGDVACDHYHRVEADVKLMAELGLKTYRFSVSWPRVLPEGSGAVNQAGLDFYRRLTDELLAHGIKPAATLYHWDLPQALEDRGGWLSRDTSSHFADYARVVGEALGDRLESIITLNEPWVSSFIGYTTGHHAPGKKDLGDGAIAAHHLLLGHGLAVPVLRDVAGSCELGITVNLSLAVAASQDDVDVRAAARHDDQLNRWFLDPILKGAYPRGLLDEYVDVAGENFVHENDLATINADIDFVGINYYTRNIVAGRREPHEPWTRQTSLGDFINLDDVTPLARARTTKGWPIDPDGLHDLLVWLTETYGAVPLYVTENGAAFIDYVDQTGSVHDSERVDYLRDHFAAAHRALNEGVNLKGYFVWSLFDNFEWADGFSQRFGLVYIDYRTQERILKDSAQWYRAVIDANAVDLP
ncbi:MAG: GH1 family beta-glucosidase [Acidimicrobiales bacterium]